MKFLQVSSLALASLAGASVVHGQSDPSEILVIANRLQQPSATVMAATTVITADDIRNSVAKNLTELLAGEAGIQIAQSGGHGSQASLFLRGTESDHTLILIDGVQVTTSTGSAGRLEYVSLDQIERIEIVRGPRSSVYGSEAIGGVLNIFTKHGSDNGFGGAINVSAGTEQSTNTNIDLSTRLSSTALAMSYSHSETDGIDASQRGDRDDDGFKRDALALSATHYFSEQTTLAVNYSRFESEAEYDDGVVDSDSSQVSTIFTLPVSSNWLASFALDRFKESNEDAAAFGLTRSHSRNTSAHWNNTIALADNLEFGFGVDVQEQKLNYESFGASQSDTSRGNVGYYGVILGQYDIADITLSLRNDDNEEFGNHSTGSIAVGKSVNDSLRAWASYGTAFKAPNLIDLYVDFPSFFFFANPNLEPETSSNTEVGLELQALAANWQFNLFHNEIDDLIAIDSSFSSLANVNQAEINGLEAIVESRVAEWDVNLSLTLLDHENKSTGEELLRRPEQTLSVSLSRQFGAFDFTVNALAQNEHRDIDPVNFGTSTVPGYGILNLIFGYRLSDKSSLRLRIGNVFDKQYEVVDGFNTYGTTAMLAFSYQL